MIDNDIDKANGELRAMLASMVNDPLVDAIRRNLDALADQVAVEVKSESAMILRQGRDVTKTIKAIHDEMDTLGLAASQIKQGVEALKATSVVTKTAIEERLAEVLLRAKATSGFLEGLPSLVRHALEDDFATHRLRLDEAVATLKSATGAAEQASNLVLLDISEQLVRLERRHIADKAEWNRTSRTFRMQIAICAALAAIGVIATAVLLARSFAY